MTLLTILLQEAASPKASGYSSIIMMVALIAIFYFFMIRPQNKKQKEIAKELNISKYIVSRVVTKDTRYEEEKEKRKQESINRHNRKKTESILKKRKLPLSREKDTSFLV